MVSRTDKVSATVQVGNGADWTNIQSAIVGDEKSAYVNLDEKKKKPKDIYGYWHLQGYDDIFKQVNALTDASFRVILTDFNENEVDYPVLAIWKKSSLEDAYESNADIEIPHTVVKKSKYVTSINFNHFSSYLDKEDLRDIVIGIKWGSLKKNQKSSKLTLSKCVFEWTYEPYQTQIHIWDWLDTDNLTTNDILTWKIAVANQGTQDGSCKIKVNLPVGCEVVNDYGQGTYNKEFGYLYGTVQTGFENRYEHYFKLRFKEVGYNYISFVNEQNSADLNPLSHKINVRAYNPPLRSIDPNPNVKILIWDYLAIDKATLGEEFRIKVAIENQGTDNGEYKVKFDLPSGCEFVSHDGNGFYDSSNNIYQGFVYKGFVNTVYQYFTFKFTQTGTKTITIKNMRDSINTGDLVHQIKVTSPPSESSSESIQVYLWDWLDTDKVNKGDTITWKLKVQNRGNATGDWSFIVNLNLPNDCSIDSHTGDGFISNNVWEGMAHSGETKEHYFKLKFSNYGEHTITAQNSYKSINTSDLTHTITVNQPQLFIWDWTSASELVTDEVLTWKVSAQNDGTVTGDAYVEFDFPSDCEVISSYGQGYYDSTTQIWHSAVDPSHENKVEHYLKIKFSEYGNKTITAHLTEDASIDYDDTITHTIKYKPYYAVSDVNPTPYVKRADNISMYYPVMCAKDPNQYVIVRIVGYPQNLDGSNQAEFRVVNGLNDVISIADDIVFEQDTSQNIESWSYEYSSGSMGLYLTLKDISQYYKITFRVPIKTSAQGIGHTYVLDTFGEIHTGEVEVGRPRKNIFEITPSISRDKEYVRSSINIGTEEDVWTINLKASRQNFFEIMDDELELVVEEQIAYIGCVPLLRPHKADLKANTTNTLIKTNYLNRKYLGKQGDYDEEIPMTLRMHWRDVATLQGLVAMDKPIPIDTCPNLMDGDPINHRGWAEIYGLKNIHKVNDLLYECEPEVSYITHDILTNFNILKGKNISDANLDYVLAETHEYGDDLLERFNLNYYEFFTNQENTNGDLVGEYEIPSMSNLTLTSSDDLSKYSNYNILFSNKLPMLKSEDYDKNWEMAIRIVDKDNTSNVLFEHLYNNFKHYDFSEDRVVNQCDSVTKVLGSDGTYRTLNAETINLVYDELYDEDNNKTQTYFNKVNDVEITSLDDELEIFLLDKNNNQLSDKKIRITISSLDNSYSEVYTSITDLFGRATFPVLLNNGSYIVKFEFDGDDTYQKCEYSVYMDIEYDMIEYHFEYPNDFLATSLNDTYEVTLLDANEDAVSDYAIHYSFKEINDSTYSHEEILNTDNEGKIYIPIQFTNGSKMLKVVFKGFQEDNTVHQPTFFEDMIRINVTGKETVIEADDLSFMEGEERQYNFRLKDKDGNALNNKNVDIGFNNGIQNYVTTVKTNVSGVAKTTLSLPRGSWDVTMLFKGDDTYAPSFTRKNVDIYNYKRLNTTLVCNGTDINVDAMSPLDLDWGISSWGRTDGYAVTLIGEMKGNTNITEPLSDKPIHFTVYKNNTKVIDTIINTNENGKAKLPYVDYGTTVTVNATFEEDSTYQGVTLSNSVRFTTPTYAYHNSEIIYDSTNQKYVLKTTEVSNKDGRTYITYDDPNRVIITKDGSTYSFDDWDENYLGIGTYNITYLWKWVSGYPCSGFVEDGLKCRNYASKTVTKTVTEDNRKELSSSHKAGFVYQLYLYYSSSGWIQVGKNSSTHRTKCIGRQFQLIANIVGFPREFRNTTDYYRLYGGYDGNDYTWCTAPSKDNTRYENTTQYKVLNGVVSENDQYKLSFLGDWRYKPYEVEFSLEDTFNVETLDTCTSFRDSSINVDGFDNETYVQLKIEASSENYYNNYADNIFNNYKVRFFDLDKDQVLTFYVPSADSTTVAKLDALLGKRNYRLEVIGEESEHYARCIYNDTTTITTDSDIEPPSDTIGNVDYSEIGVMPSLDEYDGSTFGSNILFQLRGNKLNFFDYGMNHSIVGMSAESICYDVELQKGDYLLQVDIIYNNNTFQDLYELTGNIQMGIYEDVATSDGAKEYSDILVSPMPIADAVTKFTRHTDEGTMYYVQVKDNDKVKYICNPYIQYKGGTELLAEAQFQIFNLDNGYSPITVNNGLVRADFHRRTGYVVLYRYDDITKRYHYVNALKVPNNPQLRLNSYTDDKIELEFGETTWRMWRGRPFVQVNHLTTPMRIMDLVDRVYCETFANEYEMGYVEYDEVDSLYSVFNPRTSVQRIPYELHIGESIKIDNFKLCGASATNRIKGLTNDVDLEIVKWDGQNAVKVTKNESCRCGVTFALNPNLIEKPSKDFTLAIYDIKGVGSDSDITLKVRGFDERGLVHCDNNLQVGIWEENYNTDIRYDDDEDELIANFYNVPSEVKYLDFTLILPSTMESVTFKEIMLYEGDADFEYQRDSSRSVASTKEVHFQDTYFACLFNRIDNVGLGIIRPNKTGFSLRSLYQANETILVPYMKEAREQDRVENIFFEYLNSREQIVNIDWEN